MTVPVSVAGLTIAACVCEFGYEPGGGAACLAAFSDVPCIVEGSLGMSRRNTRKAPSAAAKAAGRRLAWVRACTWVAVLGVLAAAAVLGSDRLWRAVCARQELMLDASSLSFSDCPPCIRRTAMLKELRGRLAALSQPACVFTQDLARRVAEDLADSPWVLKVEQVRRRLPNKLLVRARFREPAGVVGFEGWHCLVDNQGYWLPHSLYRWPPDWDEENTPLIVDRSLKVLPVPGERWDGPRLAAGASLTEFLRESGLLERLRIRTVDVTSVGGAGTEPDIVLVTESGVRVKWGKADCYADIAGLSALLIVNSDRKKLNMLLDKLEEYPGLDGLEYMDLRFHNKIVHKPRPPRAP